jgi:hypothetical protein
MTTEAALVRMLQELETEMRDLRLRVAHLPARWARSGGGTVAVRIGTVALDWQPGTSYIVAIPEGGGAEDFVHIELVPPTGHVPDFCGYYTDEPIAYFELGNDVYLALNNPLPRVTTTGDVYQAASTAPTNVVAQQLRIYS